MEIINYNRICISFNIFYYLNRVLTTQPVHYSCIVITVYLTETILENEIVHSFNICEFHEFQMDTQY